MSGDTARFVGREEESAALLDAVAVGAPLVLISGDAGIGKSRLVAEAMDAAVARGVVVLRGRCVGLQGKLPLLPFVEALAGMEASAVGRVPASLRPALDVVMHTTAHDPPDAAVGQGERGGGRSEWERERLVLAIAALLSPPARLAPTVVVVEDVHWADPFTLDMLTYLVAGPSTGTTCLVTLRTDQPSLPEEVLAAVGELQRLDSTVSVTLGPLPEAAVAQQVADLVGQKPPSCLVEQVVKLGGGNPFFTEQLCRHAQNGLGVGAGEAGALPPRLSGFLQSRLRRLSQPARRVLLVLGVAGVPLEATQLSTVAGLTGAVTADAVRELSNASVLARPDRALLAPRHALLATAAAESSDPVTLAETHSRVAAMLEASGDRSLSLAAAGHWAAAGRDAQELRATLVAAPVAEELSDFAMAASLWARAYDLTRKVPQEAVAGWPSLLEVAVSALRALNWSGRNDQARDLAEDALQRLSPLAQDPLGGSLRYWVGLQRSMRDLTRGTDMLREARTVLSTHPPSPDLVACLLRLGEMEASAGRAEPALTLLDQAVEAASDAGLLREEAHATVVLSHLMFSLGRSEEAIERVSALARRPETAADVRAQALLAVLESDILLQTGRLAQASTVARSAYEQMKRERYTRTWEASVLRYNAGEAELELGRTADAIEVVQAVTTGHTPDIDTTLDHLLRALADLNQGRLTAAVERIEEVCDVARATSFTEDIRATATARAAILRWAGQPQRALECATDDLKLLAGTDQQQRCSELLSWAAAAAADLTGSAHARHDAPMQARAEEVLQWLRQWVEQCPIDPFEPVHLGGRERADGLQWHAELARAGGGNDPDLWRAATQEWEQQQRTHRAAYCWWRMAQAHVDRGAPTARISAPLQRAWELSTEMAPLRAAVEEIASRARVRLTEPPLAQDPAPVELPVALTEREREILRHVVTGRSNSQIAADLFISPKTVSVHVSNLLRKIGVTNRVQAAAWADRVGLAVHGSNDRRG